MSLLITNEYQTIAKCLAWSRWYVFFIDLIDACNKWKINQINETLWWKFQAHWEDGKSNTWGGQAICHLKLFKGRSPWREKVKKRCTEWSKWICTNGKQDTYWEFAEDIMSKNTGTPKPCLSTNSFHTKTPKEAWHIIHFPLSFVSPAQNLALRPGYLDPQSLAKVHSFWSEKLTKNLSWLKNQKTSLVCELSVWKGFASPFPPTICYEDGFPEVWERFVLWLQGLQNATLLGVWIIPLLYFICNVPLPA